MGALSDVFTSETVLGTLVLGGIGWAITFGRTIVKTLKENLQETKDSKSLLLDHSAILEAQNKEIAECKRELKTVDGRSLRDEVHRVSAIAVTAVAQNDALIEDREMASYRADNEGRCLYVSKRWCQMAGMSREEAMGYGGYGWNNTLHDDDREKVSAKWRASLRDGIPFEDSFRFKTGAKVSTRAEPVRDAWDKVVVWIGTTEFIHGVEKIS